MGSDYDGLIDSFKAVVYTIVVPIYCIRIANKKTVQKTTRLALWGSAPTDLVKFMVNRRLLWVVEYLKVDNRYPC